MKKIIISFLTLLTTMTFAFANNIDSVINKSSVSKNATVSVSIRHLGLGNVAYEKDSHKLMNPASTLKAFTTPVIYDQLGENYLFKTQIYKSGNDTAYLKLSGDPLLNSKNLGHIVRKLREAELKKPQKFYIDDTFTDNLEYGIGWMWDDEVSKFIPKYSVYNLNGNVYTLEITPSSDKKSINIKTPYGYNVSVINKLKAGTKNNIIVSRNFWEGTEKVTLLGTVNSPTKVNVPVYNQRRYFISMLQDSMNSANINYYGSFDNKKTPKDAKLINEFTNSVKGMYSMILKDSNNMVAETLFKHAGAKYTKLDGTTANGIEAFNNYYKNIGVKTDDIIIVDASGVSRNDLISTDWMSNALVKIHKNDKNYNYKEFLPMPNEGTMTDRLFDLRDYLWAKTGTLANTSGLTGYITTKKGNEYAFAILIQYTNEPISEAKKLEDEIVNTIYNKY